MSHTKGPWKLVKKITSGEFGTSYQIRNDDNHMIAEVGPCEQEFNSALIAAAPEMLEALQNYIDFFDQIKATQDQDDKRAIVNLNLNHHLEVRKLIKKSKGE